jgi:hypothetical protein
VLIRNRDGAICGRIIGKSTLRTDDAILLDLWNARVAAVLSGDQSPGKAMEEILAEYGYTAFPVE